MPSKLVIFWPDDVGKIVLCDHYKHFFFFSVTTEDNLVHIVWPKYCMFSRPVIFPRTNSKDKTQVAITCITFLIPHFQQQSVHSRFPCHRYLSCSMWFTINFIHLLHKDFNIETSTHSNWYILILIYNVLQKKKCLITLANQPEREKKHNI